MWLYILVAANLLLLLIILFRMLQPVRNAGAEELKYRLDALQKELAGVREDVRAEMLSNRLEANAQSKDVREELRGNLKDFSTAQAQSLRNASDMQKEQFDHFSRSLDVFSSGQKEHFIALLNKQSEQNITIAARVDSLRDTLEKKIAELQTGNEKKLDEMRATVDEKLQRTLETRLTQSFELVNKSLESVQKGLGDMQQLAMGVGDLKKVLSNVKTRGILGEVQLGNILEQILAPDQYERDVATRPGSREHVEYAIRIPQGGDPGKSAWMPVDAKFPVEHYYALHTAYENGDAAAIDLCGKNLDATIRKCARDIRDKYLDPPHTTDVALMFLPVEGLYAEVVRRTSLVEVLQRDYRVIVAGPATLAAILSSFAFGFRTIAIEKRSGEIRQVLGAVKTEFGKFGDVLKKAQEKISRVSEDIDELVGTRTRKIQQRLRNLEELPQEQASLMIDNNAAGETDDNN